MIHPSCPPRGEARTLGGPVEAVGTDAAAADEETCGEARTLGDPVEAADTEAATAKVEMLSCAPATCESLCEEDAWALCLG